MKRRSPPQPGDIFTIPVGDAGSAFGIIREARLPEIFIIVYDALIDEPSADSDEITSNAARPILAGLTLTGKFDRGDWNILTNDQTCAASLPTPCFRVPRHGIESFENTAAQQIERPDPRHLIAVPRVTVAPIRFEFALRSIHLGEPWQDHFDTVRFETYFPPQRPR